MKIAIAVLPGFHFISDQDRLNTIGLPLESVNASTLSIAIGSQAKQAMDALPDVITAETEQERKPTEDAGSLLGSYLDQGLAQDIDSNKGIIGSAARRAINFGFTQARPK